MHQGQRDYCRAVRHVPGVAELDRVKVAAVTFQEEMYELGKELTAIVQGQQ